MSEEPEKEKSRRYQSASDLGEDLRRYLRDEPIQARPASTLYQLGKFARRNKALVGGLAGVFVALVLGIAGTTSWAMYALDQSDRARTAENDAKLLLAESYAKAARLALQRGQWREALEQYDQALEGGHPDPVALRLDKLRALLNVDEVAQATAELDALWQMPDARSHEGALYLARSCSIRTTPI